MTGFFDFEINENDRKVGGFIWRLITKPDEPKGTEVMDQFTEEELRTLSPEEYERQWKIRANKLSEQKKEKREKHEALERMERERHDIRKFEEERARLELDRDMNKMAMESVLNERFQEVKKKEFEEDSGLNHSLPICPINDDKVREILQPSEKVMAHVRYDGRLFNREYDTVVITNKRIVFYTKSGHFGQKIKCKSVSINELEFRSLEEKGNISKKTVLKFDIIGMEEPLEFIGNSSEIMGIYHAILEAKG